MKRENVRFPLIIISIVVLQGCMPLQPYHTEADKFAEEDGKTPVSIEVVKTEQEKQSLNSCKNSNNDPCISIVEYDDFGHLFNRAQMNRTVAAAEAIATHKDGDEALGGAIIVYVHGWRHNAERNDEDLRKFKDAITQVGDLNRKSFRDKRQIMGIYIGWRGQSVDLWPITYLTFWERKNSAHAVGNGAVYELFKKLSDIRRANPTSRLILVGHSLGSAVTYSSLWNAVLSQIIEDPPASAGVIKNGNIEKRWDMVVLVNSALEAMQVRSHYEAARSREYAIGQLPHLVFVTSEADLATKIAFPAGRRVSTIFKKYPKEDKEADAMNTTAIGHYIPYVTHELTTTTDPYKCAAGTEISEVDNLDNALNSPTYCFGDPRSLTDYKTGAKLVPPYIKRCDKEGDCKDVAGNHYIVRGKLEKPASANAPLALQNNNGNASEDVKAIETLQSISNPVPERMPVMNIRTTKEIMKDHGDIWNPTMQSFLFQFLLLTVTPGSKQSEETRSVSKAEVKAAAEAASKSRQVKEFKSGQTPADEGGSRGRAERKASPM